MDFRFSKDEEAFREEVRRFLKEAPPETFPLQMEDDGYGSGGWSYEYTRKLGQTGWLCRTWPRECGGLGRSVIERVILLEELAYRRAPLSANFLGDCFAHPIIKYGSDEIKKQFLPGIASGEATYWMAFSEPGAGSDLLALETRAVEDGDDYVINGQKVWSSYAHLADYAFLLARTDTSVPRHKGLSTFIVDKKTPGITVRPLVNMAGVVFHNEVFFDNVRVPKSRLVGQKGQGFAQMLKGLEGDRFWYRCVKPPYLKGILEDLVQYIRETKGDAAPSASGRALRHRLVELAVEIEVCRLLFRRAAWIMSSGKDPVYEASAGKVMVDEMAQRFFDTGMQVLGFYSELCKGSKWAQLGGMMVHWHLSGIGHTIAGGTSEIVRQTVALRGLGLPPA